MNCEQSAAGRTARHANGRLSLMRRTQAQTCRPSLDKLNRRHLEVQFFDAALQIEYR